MRQPVARMLGHDSAGIVVDEQTPAFAEDESNQLVLAMVRPAMPQRYMIGAAWREATGISTMRDWQAFMAAATARERSPVKVT